MMSYCKKSIWKKKRGHRFFAWALCFCIMLTGYSGLSGGDLVFAQEQESVSRNDMSAEGTALPKEQESVSGNGTQPDISRPEEDTVFPEFASGEGVDEGQSGEAGTRAETYKEKVEEPKLDKPEPAAQESAVSEAALQSQPEVMWQDQSSGERMYGSLQEAVGNVYSGEIVLLSDVELTSGITISGNIKITSCDPDNPCTIKNTSQDTDDRVASGRIFTVTAGHVSLQDIILDGGRNEGVTAFHPLICLAGEKEIPILKMLAGAILQNAENKVQGFCGGGINIRQGQVYMYDGAKIKACKAWQGGGIEVNGTYAAFGMAGGSIENCEAVDGGGVYVNIGMVQMLGGEITGNLATGEAAGGRNGGGGIYVAGQKGAGQAAVLIVDGRISGNKAPLSNGGGILVYGNWNLLQIDGGTIGGTLEDNTLKGNTAKNGGGISMMRGTMKLYGGTVTGNSAGLYGGGILGSPESFIELQGNPKVFGNTAGDTTDRFDNLYLDGDEDSTATGVTSPVLLTGPLTDGVQIGMSRWLYPDETGHPYRDMIVPYKGYTISQSDLDRLCDDRSDESKELYVDNMDKYALIPYDGKIVMVMAVDVSLDKDKISLEKVGNTALLTATVTPADALLKDVTWSSSNEAAATVDQDGTVTAVGEGGAVITATTVSPYHAAATCRVKVGIYRYQLTTSAAHGTITYTPASPDGIKEDEQVTLRLEPDSGYRLQEGSLSACWTDDHSVKVEIDGNTLTMPEHNTTVSAVFEPIPYQIVYHLDGGALKAGESNPDFYTIESGEIILNNPVRSGYRFIGWKGTGLTETETVARISPGSTGAREYTAVWEKEDGGGTDTYVDNEQSAEKSTATELRTAQNSQAVQSAEPRLTGNSQAIQNPRTGSHILWLYIAACLSAACMMLLTFWLPRQSRSQSDAEKRVSRDMKIMYAVLMTLASVILIFCCAGIFSYNRDARENKKENEEVISEVISVSAQDSGEENRMGGESEKERNIGEKPEKIQIDFERLKEINEDTVGWIMFNDRHVDCPLVQADDNSYYLNHSFKGEKNAAGCLFADCRNESLEERNVVIYGHNMLDRTMFGSLKDVFREDFWEKEDCDIIWIAGTDYRMRKYKIFSYYTVEEEDYYITTSFSDDADYAEFLNVIKARSFKKLDVTVTENDHILTLSTCAGALGTGKRRVIHAKLVETIFFTDNIFY